MKKMMQVLAASAIFALGLEAINAQTTNVVMVANVALTGLKQADNNNAAAVRINTRDLLNALNAGGYSFSRSAQLVLVSQSDQLPIFAVRDRNGTNVTITDISSVFSISEATEVHANNNILSYAAQTFNFNSDGVYFNVSGFTTLHRGRVAGVGISPLTRVNTLSSKVSGYGSMNDADSVFSGGISGGAARAEVD